MVMRANRYYLSRRYALPRKAAATDPLVRELMRVPSYMTFRLAQAAEAHAALERGGVSGRILLIP